MLRCSCRPGHTESRQERLVSTSAAALAARTAAEEGRTDTRGVAVRRELGARLSAASAGGIAQTTRYQPTWAAACEQALRFPHAADRGKHDAAAAQSPPCGSGGRCISDCLAAMSSPPPCPVQGLPPATTSAASRPSCPRRGSSLSAAAACGVRISEEPYIMPGLPPLPPLASISIRPAIPAAPRRPRRPRQSRIERRTASPLQSA